MIKFRSQILGLLVVMLTAATIPAQASDGLIHRSAKHVPNSYVVVFYDDVSSASDLAASLVKKHGGRAIRSTEYAMKTFRFDGPESAASAIAADSRVRYVQENTIGAPGTIQDNPGWNLDRIDQVNVPLNNQYYYTYTGSGVTVYILDTGVNAVTDLGGRVSRNMNVSIEANEFTSNPYRYYDEYGHGTKVASLVGGERDGVAKQVTFVNIRVFNSIGSCSADDYVNAINWILSDHNSNPGPAVINFSGRFVNANSVVDDATIRAVAAGLTFVGIAGNEAIDACTESPSRLGNAAQYPNNPNQLSIITAAGVKQDNTFDSRYNFGPCVDVLAPSDNVLAMDGFGAQVPFSGTSAAAPHVSGVAALHLQRFPTYSPGLIEALIKDNGSANVITGVPTGTPNLLIYNGIYERRRACCVYP